MAFLNDKEELKPGLIIFRRADVDHRNWYCRIKMPKADRYKTVSLKTPDVSAARDRAFDLDADIRFRLKHDVPVFNRSFAKVAEEYVALQEKRAKAGEISDLRVKKVKSVIDARLNLYVGSVQVHLIGHDRWDNYPSWRRAIGEGRMARPGHTRPLTDEEKAIFQAQADAEAAARAKLAILKRKRTDNAEPEARPAKTKKEWIFVSDSTIRFEMAIFDAVMSFAVSKRYVPASHRFEAMPPLKKMRRDEFSTEEYRSLHSRARTWVEKAPREASAWYRTVAYNFVLIMCNTGMRPSEAKNLRWRDVTTSKDKEGRELVVLAVRGKGKSRHLVAPKSVGDYLDRIREITKAPGLDEPVFSNHTGEAAKTLYQALIEDMLDFAKLRMGPSGIMRSTYSFRHTYATFRLSEGVDVYFLAQQMGTSVKMIEEHYGHVNTIKYADRVLQGMSSWDPMAKPANGEDVQGVGAAKIAGESEAKAKPAKRRRA